MPSLTSDPRDVTVLPADTFQPVNWIGISEVIFHQVEKTKKKKKNKQKTTRQQRKEKTKQTTDKERQKTHSNQSTGLASHSSSFTRCSSIFDKKHIWQRAYLTKSIFEGEKCATTTKFYYLLQPSSEPESEEYREVIKRIALGVHLNNRFWFSIETLYMWKIKTSSQSSEMW